MSLWDWDELMARHFMVVTILIVLAALCIVSLE